RDDLTKNIKNVLSVFSSENAVFLLEHPAEISHGDYSTNVALVFSKNIGTSHRDLAEKLAAGLREKKLKYVEKIDVAGPGFINFHLSPDFFSQYLKTI